MKKKLTKTIGLIVFVMLLQLFVTDVNAASGDVALTCVYDHPNKSMIFNISNSGSISKASGCELNGDILNWKSSDYKGFKGRDYFIEKNACPPYAVFNKNAIWDDIIFAEDESMAKSIKDKIWNGTVMSLKDQIVGEDASNDVKSNSNSNGNSKSLTLPKECECKESFDGTNISVTFKVNKNYKDPGNVTIKFGAEENKEEIENWGKKYSGVNYTYVDDLINNDKCPDYAIVARGRFISIANSYFLLVSDEKHLSDLKREAGGKAQYALPCKDKKNVITSNSNSNKTSNSNKVSNSNYDDPEVSSNVIRSLSYDVSTYSCGDEYLTGIPARIPKLGKFVMNFLQILIPIILIIYGSIDLVKAVYASKEDDIKKGQQTFVKRLIGAIVIYFVFAIVRLVVSVVSNNNVHIMECVDCILRDSTSCKEEA